MTTTPSISQKKAIVSNLEQDANSIEQLFSIYFLAAAVATSVRWVAHWFTETGWQPLLVDGVLAIGFFVFWRSLQNNKIITRLLEAFLLWMQVSIAFLWLLFLPVYELTPPVTMLLIFLYLLYINRGAYLMWSVGGAFVSIVAALILQWLNREETVGLYHSKGEWQYYTLMTLCISAVSIMVLTYVYHRISKEREYRLAQTALLERARHEAEQKRDLLAQLRALQSDFFLEEDLQLQFNRLLRQLLEFTDSKYGFLAEVTVDESQQLVDTKLHATVYNRQFEQLAIREQEQHLERVFQYMIAEQKAIINNNPVQQHGEAPLFDIDNYLSLPVMYNYRIVGHVLVTNREGGYSEALAENLAPFLSTYGSVLQNIRLKRAQRNYENQLREAKEQAEQSNHRKSQFLTNISHELRTPLSLIMGPLTMLQQLPFDQLTHDTLQQYLQTMDRNSRKMLSYLEDIIDLAKFDVQEQQVDLKPTPLLPLLQTCFDAYQTEAEERQFEYELVYPLHPQLTVLADGSKLQKIINNLLSNAYKYSKDRGSVRILVEELSDGLCIKVCDKGKGIPKAQQRDIFKRFYQVEGPDESIFSGTGLGLSLCREWSQALGYKIEVESELGKGSCFCLIIPQPFVALPEDASPTTTLVDTTPVEKTRPCLLVAEDNRDMRLFLDQILGIDYEVVLAENGRRAWEALTKHPHRFDLLITDLMMPEMDGYALLDQVHGQPWADNLPVIVLTAKAQFDPRLGNLRIGMDDYLTKPFEVGELLATVQYLLSNRVFR